MNMINGKRVLSPFIAYCDTIKRYLDYNNAVFKTNTRSNSKYFSKIVLLLNCSIVLLLSAA